MTPNRLRLLLGLALLVILFGTLTLFFWDFVRDTIAVPIYYLLWVGNLTLKSIPQQAYLAALIIVSIMIALNTLRNVRLNQPSTPAIEERHSTSSRYVAWRKVVDNLATSEFSREQFVQESRKLILMMLAYQEHVTTAEVENMVRDGRLVLPDHIAPILQRQALQVSERPPTTFQNSVRQWRNRLSGGAVVRDPRLDQQVDDIIQFIEQQLELNHARQ